ncbi:MAG: hypothetical protein SWH68_07115 [Thermodesulfobacteriota bacterium]|nr:hypothetical protein [Thermodesulfobacteriota bacterium]
MKIKQNRTIIIVLVVGILVLLPLISASAPASDRYTAKEAWQRMFLNRAIEAGHEEALIESIASGVPVRDIAQYMLNIGYSSLYASFLFQKYARDVYDGQELDAYVAEMDSQLMAVGIPRVVIDLSKRMDVADINNMIDREAIDLPSTADLQAILAGEVPPSAQPPGEAPPEEPAEEEGLGFGDDATLGGGLPMEQISFNTGADPTVASPASP